MNAAVVIISEDAFERGMFAADLGLPVQHFDSVHAFIVAFETGGVVDLEKADADLLVLYFVRKNYKELARIITFIDERTGGKFRIRGCHLTQSEEMRRELASRGEWTTSPDSQGAQEILAEFALATA